MSILADRRSILCAAAVATVLAVAGCGHVSDEPSDVPFVDARAVTDADRSADAPAVGVDTRAPGDAAIVGVDAAAPTDAPSVGGDAASTVDGGSAGCTPAGAAHGDLSSFLAMAGGVVTVPAGTYTAASLPSGITRTRFLVLVAECASDGHPTVTVIDPVDLLDQQQIMFVGFRFLRNLSTGLPAGGHDASGHHPSTRIVSWYGDHSNWQIPAPAAGGSDSTQGVIANVDSQLFIVGGTVHDTQSDGARVNGGELHFQGVREWNVAHIGNGVCDVSTDHPDGVQISSGSFFADGIVLGARIGENPATYTRYANPPGDSQCITGGARVPIGSNLGMSHIFYGGDSGEVMGTVTNAWLLNGGMRQGLESDGKSNHSTVAESNVRVWAFPPGIAATSHDATGTITGPPVATTPPALTDVAPDVAWRAAHPFGTYMAWLAASGL